MFRSLPQRYACRKAAVASLLLCLSACSGAGSSFPSSLDASQPSGVAPFSGPRAAFPQSAALHTLSANQSSPDPYGQAVLGDRPLAYYRLNDANGTLADSTANALNGSYGSGVKPSTTPVRGSAVGETFPGGSYNVNDFATVAKNQLLQPSNALSIEAWVKQPVANNTNQYNTIVGYGHDLGYALQVDPSNRPFLYIRTSQGRFRVQSATQLAPKRGYQIAATYDGQTASIYINGKLDSSGGARGAIYVSSLYGLAIGAAQNSPFNTFDGDVSDVSVYDHALTASEVSNHYTTGNAVVSGPSPAPSATPSQPSVAAYDATVLNDKALAFFRLNDSGSQLVDSVTGLSAGTYGSSVRLGGVSLTSDGGSTAIFGGGPALPNSEAIATPATGLQVVNAVSVEAWFSEPALQSRQYIGLAAYGSNATGWQPYGLHISGNTIEFDVHPRNAGMNVYGPLLQAGVTHHAVGTYDGSNVSLYLDGELVAAKHVQGQFIYHTNGFSIGGSIGSVAPAFNGTVGDVAVYGYALSAAQVKNHYIAGATTSMVAEKPGAANAFVDSIGVNTHFSQWPYIGSNQSTTEALLAASGIRHIREGMVGSTIASVNRLAASGVRAEIVPSINATDAELKSWPSYIPSAFEAYEGPNEPNYLGSNWVALTRAFMQRLSADVRGTPALQGFPVIAPAVSSGQAQMGDLSAYVDYGNMHDYFATFNPGTMGWGSVHAAGVYGSLTYNMNMAGLISGSKPVVATETGYGSTTSGGSGYLDNATAAKYITRTYFVHYNAGVARTFVYEFLDQNSSGKPFTNNGLVDLSLQPKPSYKALHAIIADLSDAGSSFTPAPLVYQMSGNLANVRHTLLQKANGTYYLALWLEVPSWSGTQPRSVAPQSITVTTRNGMTSTSVMQLDDSGNASVTSLAGVPGHSVSLPVTDRISILQLTP